MGLDIGKLLRNVLSAGTTYFRDQKQAKKKEKKAHQLIAENTALAESLQNRDYGQSQWENVQADPALRAAQDRALSRLEGLSQTGFDNLDRQALDQSFNQSRREEQAQREAAMSAAARRGDASGGNALMSSLMAQQGGADRAAQFSTDVGLAGRDRALSALESYGQQAGQMRGQDFSEQGQRAQGLEGFKQWTTGQQNQTAQMLMNARLGQSQSLQQQAQQQASTPNAEAAGQAGLAYATSGISTAAGVGGDTGATGSTTSGLSAPQAPSTQQQPAGAPDSAANRYRTMRRNQSQNIPGNR